MLGGADGLDPSLRPHVVETCGGDIQENPASFTASGIDFILGGGTGASLSDLSLARPPDSKASRTLCRPGGATVTRDVTPKAESMTTRRIHSASHPAE